MKKITLAYLVIFLLILGCSDSFNGVKITGKVINSNQEYVYLAHQPKYRGNFNSDGFRSIGNRIDDNGKFKLVSDKLIDGANYWITIKDKVFQLILFNGDNINFKIDLNNFDSSFFAQGKGAGKINVLRLHQFEPNLWFDTIYTMDTYKTLVDSVIDSQLSLLNEIYNKNIKSEIIQKAHNKQTIINIIKKTPLSTKEYEFLMKKISSQDIEYLLNFLSFLNQEKKGDTSKVNLESEYFSCFNPSRYRQFDNINSWEIENCIENILNFEYLKSIQKKNNQITYENFRIDDYDKYQDWCLLNAKKYLNPKVLDAYYSSNLLWDLSLGDYNKDAIEHFVRNCNDKKYINTINRYIDLLNNGLSNKEYNLNNDNLTLDSLRFDSLITSNQGKDLYLVIWSAQFAGSTIISELPSITEFAKDNQNKIEIAYICIDNSKFKNLWATRIIDNSWNGNHYFLPAENNDYFINRLAAQKISSFCYGGATYTFIDKKGQIINGVESPILLTNDKIDKYLNYTIR